MIFKIGDRVKDRESGDVFSINRFSSGSRVVPDGWPTSVYGYSYCPISLELCVEVESVLIREDNISDV